MASNLTPAGSILNGITANYNTGWNEASELELALSFIGECNLTKWHEFLVKRAKDEMTAFLY